ncbi:ABC transporter ATP-binding protein [Sinisalibacter aestuarii]|uniref:ATP-binding protein n=1 Tax=Sinisalibacter aestuarii TaxID=2949426 RepID=A0ABQ5LNG7_9RHOB|nr:ABC transporter ATP-binding protein [Sinisalibacter aestuarii]GKY86552.1 ATP-binding protein [Sinisalibacter aestuarii]
MIQFENISKSFWVNGKRKTVIGNFDLTLPSGKAIALLGRNGAGKSTLLQLVSGNLRPDTGKILSDGSISWPVGLAGAFHRDLTGAQNVRFLARIYGVDTRSLEAFVRDFAELGPHFRMPLRSYSSGMRSRLTFGAAMGIKFDTYLIDEVTAVGDAVFRQKSRAVFRERVKSAGALMVSHNMEELRTFCDAGMILDHGHLQYFENVEDAIEQHQRNMRM